MNKKEIMEGVRGQKRVVLTEIESKEFLKGAGISVVEARLARSMKEAVALAKEMDFPVVLNSFTRHHS